MNFNRFSRQQMYGAVLSTIIFVIVVFFGFRLFKNQKSDDVLIVGMLGADAPFMSMNETGEFEGFDVDVAAAVAKQLGKRMEIQEMGVAELFIALEQERIDMMMCGLAITKSRLEKLAMVHYQGDTVTHYPLVFWKQIPRGVTKIEDLASMNPIIATLPATTMEEFLLKYPFITVKPINSYADIIMELQFGKIMAAFFDEAITSYMQRFPEIKILQIPLGAFTVYGNGIAINKKNNLLADAVAEIMEHLKKDGTIAGLEEKWHMRSK